MSLHSKVVGTLLIGEKRRGSGWGPKVIRQETIKPRLKNYSSRAYLWPFGIHVITDVCHPVHDWYILLSRISISRIQPLPIPKNFPMVQEPQRKRKEPTLRRT